LRVRAPPGEAHSGEAVHVGRQVPAGEQRPPRERGSGDARGAVPGAGGGCSHRHGQRLLQAVGLASFVGGLIFVLVSLLNLQRTWKSLALVIGVVGVALVLFAAFIPWVRSWWFDWLGGLVRQWRVGQLAWGWFVVAAFILLPALDNLVRVLWLRLRRSKAARRERATLEGAAKR
jgi:hypothetical protein